MLAQLAKKVKDERGADNAQVEMRVVRCDNVAQEGVAGGIGDSGELRGAATGADQTLQLIQTPLSDAGCTIFA